MPISCRCAEKLAELVLGGVVHVDLVGNPPQKGLVDQLLGLEVGREDDELVEGHLDLPAAGQGQDSRAAFPAGRSSGSSRSAGETRWRPKSSITSVPQLLFIWTGLRQTPVSLWTVISRLSIVSSPPTTMVGRRMRTQRRSIFSSSHDPLASGQRHLLVAARIEEADDFAPHADGAGDPDARAVGGGDAFGDAGLAVAGRAVQEQSPARGDRPAQPEEHFLAEGQVGERPAEVVHPRPWLSVATGRPPRPRSPPSDTGAARNSRTARHNAGPVESPRRSSRSRSRSAWPGP